MDTAGHRVGSCRVHPNSWVCDGRRRTGVDRSERHNDWFVSASQARRTRRLCGDARRSRGSLLWSRAKVEVTLPSRKAYGRHERGRVSPSEAHAAQNWQAMCERRSIYQEDESWSSGDNDGGQEQNGRHRPGATIIRL
jgi:hypothetical protein